jgi:CubicO group peptidase (beta-lactamase class C family)
MDAIRSGSGRRACAASALLLLVLALVGCAQGLRRASTPEEVGLSTPALQALSDALKGSVDKGEIPGAVVLVVRDGRIAWFDAVGYQDRAAGTPMAVDSIFRIASMTKPVTSLAVMMLVEEGRLRLDDPLACVLPQFSDVTVGVETRDAAGKPHLALEKPHRPITIRDLLRHTSGFTYAWAGKSLVRERYAAANFYDPALTAAQAMSKLSTLPLQAQPGTTWEYGLSTDVLAWVVEAVSGMGFDRFVAQRITEPLRMHDTAFWVEPEKLARVAEPRGEAAARAPARPPAGARPTRIQGDTGLTSTAGDYARFCQFLLNGGELDGVRLVSRQAIDAMRSDQLPAGTRVPQPEIWRDLRPTAANGQGFGLGVMVRTSAGTAGIPGNVGSFWWSGSLGTDFFADPRERLCVVQMVPLPFGSARQFQLRAALREQIYRAVRPSQP